MTQIASPHGPQDLWRGETLSVLRDNKDVDKDKERSLHANLYARRAVETVLELCAVRRPDDRRSEKDDSK